jgi:hypothetical protein
MSAYLHACMRTSGEPPDRTSLRTGVTHMACRRAARYARLLFILTCRGLAPGSAQLADRSHKAVHRRALYALGSSAFLRCAVLVRQHG